MQSLQMPGLRRLCRVPEDIPDKTDVIRSFSLFFGMSAQPRLRTAPESATLLCCKNGQNKFHTRRILCQEPKFLWTVIPPPRM